MVGYLSHFVWGGAVAPPDMAVQYLLRVLPVMVIGLLLAYHREIVYMIRAASVDSL